METNYINWNEDEQLTIDNMNLDTLVLIMERQDTDNKDLLENVYTLEGEL